MESIKPPFLFGVQRRGFGTVQEFDQDASSVDQGYLELHFKYNIMTILINSKNKIIKP